MDKQIEDSPNHGVVRSLTDYEGVTTFLTRQDIIVAQKEDPVLEIVREWIAKRARSEWQDIPKHGQQKKGGAKAKNVQQQRKSLYSEAGVFNKNSHQNKPDNNRTSWYAEIGLYPKPPTDAPSAENIETKASFHVPRNSSEVNECSNINPQPVFSSLLDELNSKVINSNVGTETETPYYNQSLDSFNSTDSGAVHDLAFLEDEPLYQFYDPTSISDYDNSDFENEIYEDVDERNEIYISSTPTPVLMSVSRSDFNFTRSLWCETPEVTKSAVLSKLSPQQKKLQEAKFEVITSEASYLNSLNVLCNHFVSRFANSNIVNERDMNELFGKVKEGK
nr:uncharacterized protein LOC111515369 [Leptinotarsa decemlineata]